MYVVLFALLRFVQLIDYAVRLADARRHWFEVDCRIRSSAQAEDFELPSWIPGSYLLREYARHVVRAVAFDANGNSAAVEKLAHNRWRCTPHGGAVTLRLTVYALDESVRGAWFDTQRAWFNGPCLFVCPLSQPDAEVRLTVEAPSESFEQWQVATAMTNEKTDHRGYGDYRAKDYDELLDHPFVLGDFDALTFDVSGVSHSLIVSGGHDGDLARVANDLKKICAAQIDFFGGSPPFDRYVFVCLVVADGYGGLEHRNSSTLMFSRSNLPRPGDDRLLKGYQRMLSLASHEYFHTWHVKRTKPAAFMPYRLAERNFTRLLWVFEGVTSYYQDRFLVRSGVIDASAYLRRVEEMIASVMRVPGRFLQSLADSSFDAWDKLYKPNSDSLNSAVSYYSKGALAALALDLEIRRQHEGQLSLDDVMQSLWNEYGAQDRGVPEDGFESLAMRIAGEGLAKFFEQAIRSTDDLPLAGLFEHLGVELQAERSRAHPWLGIVPRAAKEGVECATVLDGGPAQSAGLNPRDIIVAVNRRKLTFENISQLLQCFSIGDVVSLSYFRGDVLLQTDASLTQAPPDSFKLLEREDADPAQQALRSAWLTG